MSAHEEIHVERSAYRWDSTRITRGCHYLDIRTTQARELAAALIDFADRNEHVVRARMEAQ